MGGWNLYVFCGNDAINTWDRLGLSSNIVLEMIFKIEGCNIQIVRIRVTILGSKFAGWTYVTNRTDIPGYIEIKNDKYFLNLDGTIITFDELVQIEKKYSPKDSDEWKKRILDSNTQNIFNADVKSMKEVENIIREYRLATDTYDAYDNAHYRETVKPLNNALASLYNLYIKGRVLWKITVRDIMSATSPAISSKTKLPKLDLNNYNNIDDFKEHLKKEKCSNIKVVNNFILAEYKI